jgi:acyl-coenzyme A synthetase/AMP-(fatty) acid ligase
VIPTRSRQSCSTGRSLPREIEYVIAYHPAVAAVAVIGLPDPVFGEQIRLHTAGPRRVSQCVRAAGAMRAKPCPFQSAGPRDFLAQMSRTPLGKIQKFQLQRELLETEQGPASRHPPANVPGH